MPGFVAEHLHKPENRYLHTAIKAAIENKVPTAFFLDGREDPTKWLPKDKKLALAWQTYQDELCPKCGVPIWLGHSEDAHIEFELKTTVCYSCQALEEDKKEPPKGGIRFAVPKAVEIEGEDIRLPTRAEGLETAQ